jgi:hypothetical protein
MSGTRNPSIQVRAGQGPSQSEGRVLLEPELVQEPDIGAVPAHEKGLGRPAGGGPALQEGIEVLFGIDPQEDHAQGAGVEDRNEDRQVDRLARGVPVKIQEPHSPGPQDLESVPREVRRRRLGRFGDGQARDASSIEQDNPVVLMGCLHLAEPCRDLRSRARVLRRLEPPPYQAGENGVAEEDGAIRQAFSPPPRQLAHLQLGDGGKLVPDLGAEVALVGPVGEVSGRRDARRQESNERDENDASAARTGRSNSHRHDFKPATKCPSSASEMRALSRPV